MKRHIAVLSTFPLLLSTCFGQNIYTVAGHWTENGSLADGVQAIRARLGFPASVAADASGNLYITDTTYARVRRVATWGNTTTVAGNGSVGYSGDGGAATSASFTVPGGLALDSSGNIYIADAGNHRVRKVTAAGIVSTVAGTGTGNYSGDGGAAVSAALCVPEDVALDSSGNLYIADYCNYRVRKVTPAGIVSTVAGNGVNGCTGDGGAATGAQLKGPRGLTVDSSGNLYIADDGCHTVRKVTPQGVISNVAGTAGSLGFSGDGGAATNALLSQPKGVAIDGSGNLYIADYGNYRVRKVTSGGTISTMAGAGSQFGGDGGPATSAGLSPWDVTLDASGNLYIADAVNCYVRVVAQGTSNPLPNYVSKVSVFRAGLWVKDYNANGVWDGPGTDQAVYLGQSGDVPLVGDWNGDGRAKTGIFRNGMWVLDYNGNGQWDGTATDKAIYLGQAGDTPVVGDWNGSGTGKVGIFRAGLWVLDYNGNGVWNGSSTDRAFYLGQAGDTPVVGDWNNTGTTKVGIFRDGLWVLDRNGNGTWDGPSIDRAYYLGQAGDTPVVGDWTGGGTARLGIFRGGLWVLDYDGSGTWDGPSIDKAIYLGQSGDTAVIGTW